jgi:hypothetical protein
MATRPEGEPLTWVAVLAGLGVSNAGLDLSRPIGETIRGFEVIRGLDGTSRRAAWKPVPVRVLRAEEGGPRRQTADLPWLGSQVLVLSSRAVATLGEALERSGELLPLKCRDAEYWLFNALCVVDALDETQSELVRFAGGGVMKISQHVFDPRKLYGVEVFKLPQMLSRASRNCSAVRSMRPSDSSRSIGLTASRAQILDWYGRALMQ